MLLRTLAAAALLGVALGIQADDPPGEGKTRSFDREIYDRINKVARDVALLYRGATATDGRQGGRSALRS